MQVDGRQLDDIFNVVSDKVNDSPEWTAWERIVTVKIGRNDAGMERLRTALQQFARGHLDMTKNECRGPSDKFARRPRVDLGEHYAVIVQRGGVNC